MLVGHDQGCIYNSAWLRLVFQYAFIGELHLSLVQLARFLLAFSYAIKKRYYYYYYPGWIQKLEGCTGEFFRREITLFNERKSYPLAI